VLHKCIDSALGAQGTTPVCHDRGAASQCQVSVVCPQQLLQALHPVAQLVRLLGNGAAAVSRGNNLLCCCARQLSFSDQDVDEIIRVGFGLSNAVPDAPAGQLWAIILAINAVGAVRALCRWLLECGVLADAGWSDCWLQCWLNRVTGSACPASGCS
jgi:hypothetical protein